MDLYKPLIQLLKETRIIEILPNAQNIITVQASTQLRDVVKVLSEEKILSVPVKKIPEVGTQHTNYIGFVDMLDILPILVSIFVIDTSVHIGILKEKGKQLGEIVAEEFINFSEKDPWKPLNMNASLIDAINLFKEGIHRAPIVNDNQELVGLLTQSYLLQFLAQNLNHASGPICHQSIEELDIISANPLFVPYTARAIDAFHEMYNQRLSSIAVVEENGQFLTSLSASDLRGFSEDNIQNLLLPISEYKNSHKRVSVTITPHHHFETVIMKLAANHIHRLYVVDSTGHPIGVVSLTDICRALAKLKQ